MHKPDPKTLFQVVSWHQRAFCRGKDYEEVAAETCEDEGEEDYGEELKMAMMLHECSCL